MGEPEAAQEVCGCIVFRGSPPSRVEAAARPQKEGGRHLVALLQLREVCHFAQRFFLDNLEWNYARIK